MITALARGEDVQDLTNACRTQAARASLDLDRFYDALKRCAGRTPTELVSDVMDELGKFKGQVAQVDDVTVVAVRYVSAN